MEQRWMNLYTYKMISEFNGFPLTIEALIYSKDHADADRLWYWKILTEFTPKEFTNIFLDAILDTCEEKRLNGDEAINCNRGILNFTAVLKDEDEEKYIRSISQSSLQMRDKDLNLHSTITPITPGEGPIALYIPPKPPEQLSPGMLLAGQIAGGCVGALVFLFIFMVFFL